MTLKWHASKAMILHFGLSVSGAITSIASFFQPFVMPEGAVLAYGNQVSCDAVAFPLYFGDTGALQLYALGLCTYYLHAIRNNRRASGDFAKRIPLLGSIVKLSVGNFNSSDVGCWIVSQPLNCADNPDVECIRGANAHIYRWLFAVMPSTVSLVGIVYIVAMISWTVIKQERRNDRYRLQFEQTTDSTRNALFRHLRGFVVVIIMWRRPHYPMIG